MQHISDDETSRMVEQWLRNSAADATWTAHRQELSQVELRVWIVSAVDHSSQHTADVDELSACTRSQHHRYVLLVTETRHHR